MTYGNDIKHIRTTARKHASSIIREVQKLPLDAKRLGFIITKTAFVIGLIEDSRKSVKGNTLIEWSKSTEVDGRNTPNAWALTSAIKVMLENKKIPDLTPDEKISFVYYYLPTDDFAWLASHS